MDELLLFEQLLSFLKPKIPLIIKELKPVLLLL